LGKAAQSLSLLKKNPGTGGGPNKRSAASAIGGGGGGGGLSKKDRKTLTDARKKMDAFFKIVDNLCGGGGSDSQND
jgi:hypothetical protein